MCDILWRVPGCVTKCDRGRGGQNWPKIARHTLWTAPYVAARAGVEPTTPRLKVIVSTKTPPRPTTTLAAFSTCGF